MKVKQVVAFKFHTAYIGWQGLEFTDTQGDTIEMELSEDQYLSLEENIVTKCDRIRKERAQKAASLLEESENE